MDVAQLDLIINAAPAKAGRAEFEREVAQLESKATASAGRITKGHETAGASIRGMGREVAAAGAVFGSAGGPVTAFAGRLSTVGTAVEEMTRSLGAARVGKQALEAAFTSGLTAAPTIGAALAAQAAGYEKLKAAQEQAGKTTQWLNDLQTKAATAKLDLSTAKANVGDAKAELAAATKGSQEYEAAQARVAKTSTTLRAETKAESDARAKLTAVTVKDKAARDALNAAMRDQQAITETVAVASNSYGAALAGVAVKATAIVGVIAAVGAGVAAYEVLKKSLNEGGELEALETRFATMIGNSQAARAEMEKLENLHVRSPFDLADLEKAEQRLYSVGVGTNDLSQDLRRLADVAVGTGQKSVGSLAEAYARVRAEGQLTADTYSQLLSQGLDLTEPLRKVTGRSGEAMRSALSAGAVSFNQFRAMLIAATSEGGQFYQSLERQNETFKGQTSQVEREINALFGEFGEGAATALSGPLKDFNAWLDGLRPKAREVGEEFGHWIEGIDKLRREGKLGEYLEKEFDGAVDHFVSYLGSKVTLQNLLGPANPNGPVGAANASNPFIQFMDWLKRATPEDAAKRASEQYGSGGSGDPSLENGAAEKLQRGIAAGFKEGIADWKAGFAEFAGYGGASGYGDSFASIHPPSQFPPVGDAKYPSLGFGGGSSATNIAAAVSSGVVEGITSTKATVFGLNMDGSRDKDDNGRGNFISPLQGGYFNTRDPELAGAALPPTVTGGHPGYVFVKNATNGQYEVVPLVDTGPSPAMLAQGKGIDLTPEARRQIGINDSDADPVEYKFFRTLDELETFLKASKLPADSIQAFRTTGFDERYRMANESASAARDSAYRKQFGLPTDYAATGSGGAGRLPALNGPVRQVSNAANTPAFGDAKTVQEATAEIEKIQALVAATTLDAQEGARRIADITARAAGSIYNPTQFTQFLGRYRAAMLERERVAKATQDKIARGEASVAEAAIAGVHKATDAYANTGQVISDIAQRGTEQLGDGLSGALVDSATNGKDAWKDFAVSFLKDIEKMILKALILKAINAAIGGISGSFGGAASGAGSGIFGGADTAGVAQASIHHAGGIVGAGGAPTRDVAASLFAGAPRFHGGGVVGLKPGEVPIIAMEGERVQTEEQQRMSQLAPVEAMAGGSVSNSNHIEIHVQPGGQATARGGGGQDDQAFYKFLGGQVQKMVDARVAQQIGEGKRSGGVFNPRGNAR